jgi:hypothetical protein
MPKGTPDWTALVSILSELRDKKIDDDTKEDG